MGFGNAYGQSKADRKHTFKALLFGDYYWNMQHHDGQVEGINGFRFRRVNVTLDSEISKSFSSRLRLESRSTGDYSSSTKLTPYVKDAYLQWKAGQHAIIAGISGTPTFGLVEDVWGYRSVAKSPLDLQGMSSSRDFGVAAQGTMDPEERWRYHVMIGNGNGTRPELDTGKKIMGSLTYALSDELFVQGYADYNSREDGQYNYTLQGFAGFQRNSTNFGALFAHQNYHETPAYGSYNLNIVSLFGNVALSKRATSIFRVDHLFNPNPAAGEIDYLPMNENARPTIIIAGLDIRLDEEVHLIPNIERIWYSEPNITGEDPSNDMVFKLTLFYNF